VRAAIDLSVKRISVIDGRSVLFDIIVRNKGIDGCTPPVSRRFSPKTAASGSLDRVVPRVKMRTYGRAPKFSFNTFVQLFFLSW
jgi:hypothetical protein